MLASRSILSDYVDQSGLGVNELPRHAYVEGAGHHYCLRE